MPMRQRMNGQGQGQGRGRGRRGRGRGCGRGPMGHGCCHGDCHALSDLETGGRAVIDSLRCQGGYKRKLLSMGVIPGREVFCIRDNGSSGLCIRVGTSDFIVNNDIAEDIHIRTDIVNDAV